MNTGGKFEFPLLPHIKGHKGYVPGEQPDTTGWVKLNTNENPYPPSPKVKEAIAAQVEGLRLYSSPDGKALRESLAKEHGIDPAGVILGNGSDDILNVLVRSFVNSSSAKLGTILPGYSLYPVLAGLQGAELVELQFDQSFSLPVGQISELACPIFFLTSPNAPSGVGFPNADLRKVLESYQGLLVVDEAYADFAEENAVELLQDYPNLFVTRTFSKSYSLAGLRVGYGLGDPDLIRTLHGVRDVYNVDRLAQAGAQAAFEDREYFNNCLDAVKKSRGACSRKLSGWGWITYPSQTNFLFTQPVDSTGKSGASVAQDLFQTLKSQNILVRYFGKHPLTDSYLRITIGTDQEMETLENAIELWRKK